MFIFGNKRLLPGLRRPVGILPKQEADGRERSCVTRVVFGWSPSSCQCTAASVTTSRTLCGKDTEENAAQWRFVRYIALLDVQYVSGL